MRFSNLLRWRREACKKDEENEVALKRKLLVEFDNVREAPVSTTPVFSVYDIQQRIAESSPALEYMEDVRADMCVASGVSEQLSSSSSTTLVEGDSKSCSKHLEPYGNHEEDPHSENDLLDEPWVEQSQSHEQPDKTSTIKNTWKGGWLRVLQLHDKLHRDKLNEGDGGSTWRPRAKFNGIDLSTLNRPPLTTTEKLEV